MREDREMAEDVRLEYAAIKKDSAMMGRIKGVEK